MASMYETSDNLAIINTFHEGYYEYGDLNEDSETLQEHCRSLMFLEKYLPVGRGKKIFEIGCGNGLFLALARKRGWEVDGVESSQKNVGIAREKFLLPLHYGLFEEFQGSPESYDAVAMLDVLEHRHDPKTFLEKALGLIKKGGLMLIAVPNHDSFLRLLSCWVYGISGQRLSTGMEKVYLLEHTAYYSKETLGALFRMINVEPLTYFQSSTDLARYNLQGVERCVAHCILTAGKILGMQNRLIAIGRRI